MHSPIDAITKIQLVVFDLDGTLVDSAQDLAESVNRMRQAMGLGPLAHSLISTYVGQGVRRLVEQSIGAGAGPAEVEKGLRVFLDGYRGHMLDHTKLYPGVPETLEALQGRTLAVLTNKPVRFSRDMLAGLGVAGRFAFIYGGDSFAEKKPDPVGLARLMEETGMSPRATMMVGDSDTDVLTGRNAGVWTCGVTYGFGAHTLEEAPPDLIVGDIRDLPLLLDGKKAW